MTWSILLEWAITEKNFQITILVFCTFLLSNYPNSGGTFRYWIAFYFCIQFGNYSPIIIGITIQPTIHETQNCKSEGPIIDIQSCKPIFIKTQYCKLILMIPLLTLKFYSHDENGFSMSIMGLYLLYEVFPAGSCSTPSGPNIVLVPHDLCLYIYICVIYYGSEVYM